MEQKKFDALESMFDVETRNKNSQYRAIARFLRTMWWIFYLIIGVTVTIGGLVLLISIPTSQTILAPPFAAHFHTRRTQRTNDGDLPA